MKLEHSGNPIIYLKSVNFSELESLIKFIYLGEATFYEERMNEFIAVAKSLEIKERIDIGENHLQELQLDGKKVLILKKRKGRKK